ncbi:uncharacterized protein LOC126819109 [Patella vulgata]|uniref:uncharacterized protein LOC126819109 n=1 Tax=Patella vulgata TaxID=6465 RepID=UPI00217F3FBF|nr:uncharacterized protein LOC126819109 [Patella vulgata]
MAAKSKTVKEVKNVRYIPYARGFKVPTTKDQVLALGLGVENKLPIPKEYTDTTFSDVNPFTFFKNIQQPTSIDDWLAQYNEEGQTYSQYLKQCPWLSPRKVKGMHEKFVSSAKTLSGKYPGSKIYIVPVGEFNEEDYISFSNLLDYSKRFLCLPIATLPHFKLQQNNDKLFWVDEPSTKTTVRSSPRTRLTELKSRFHTKTGNLQVQISPLLIKLRQNIPQDAFCLIGLTRHDLYSDESDLFVAGMAAGNHGVAVFSLNRYDPSLSFSTEFWYERYKVPGYTEEERRHLILQRSCKLVVHEICHILGLAHCIFFDCCMNGSGHLAEDFQQPMHLCPVDLRKLQTLCGFNTVQRYEQLLEFYKKFKMESETVWVERRIAYLKQK